MIIMLLCVWPEPKFFEILSAHTKQVLYSSITFPQDFGDLNELNFSLPADVIASMNLENGKKKKILACAIC